MTEPNSITSVLSCLVSLLIEHNQQGWANGFERLSRLYQQDPETAIARIRRVYAGMGSFNDLVLHKDRVPLITENDELDRLRRKLYDLTEPWNRHPPPETSRY